MKLIHLLAKFLPKIPFNRSFGLSLGTPIDRYYIEGFLYSNRDYIKGDILEVAERTYTARFGAEISSSTILDYGGGEKEGVLNLDLKKRTGDESLFDCFILTQTLPFIFEHEVALMNAFRLLRPGGTLLLTVPGIVQVSRYDYDRWGQYWSYTKQSLTLLINTYCPGAELEVNSFGNVKTAVCGLYGIPSNYISPKVLDYCDEDYQVIITARVTRPL